MTGLCFDFSEEQELLRSTVRRFTEREATKEDARRWEQAHDFPRELFERLGNAGLYGIGVPEEYGGAGGNLIDQVIVCEELARTLAGLSVLWHLNCWSGSKAISTHGTKAQKDAYLPALAAGKILFAIAMTEPGGGTDVLRAMQTRATPVEGGFVINGTKIWSTLAHVADKLLVLVRTSDGERPQDGLSMMIVDGAVSGLTARPIPKLGLRSLGSCEVHFDNVFVPHDDLIGQPGTGWRQILGSLNNERILTAAMCNGILAGVLEDAVSYSLQRSTFGNLIGKYQAIQHKMARMKMNLETARLHTFRAAWLQLAGRSCGVEATAAKYLSSKYAVAGADEGIQILGGYGYAEEFDMQRYWRDARLFKIGPITNEMALNIVAESLGLPRSF